MSAISKPGPEDDGDASGGVTKPVDGSRLITRHHKTMTLIIQKMKMFSLSGQVEEVGRVVVILMPELVLLPVGTLLVSVLVVLRRVKRVGY